MDSLEIQDRSSMDSREVQMYYNHINSWQFEFLPMVTEEAEVTIGRFGRETSLSVPKVG